MLIFASAYRKVGNLLNAGVVELVDTLDLGHSEIKNVKILKCGRGGIGRHVRLRI